MQEISEKNTTDLRQLTQEKNLTFVRVYEQLLKMMINGTFPGDSWLPSEPKLAALLGVSRMPLRQALELLQEDGLIQKHHGKGNFVVRQGTKQHRSLDFLGHPVYQCCDVTIDHIETEFRIEVPNEQNNELFQRESAVMIAVDRWYRNSGNIVAYTLTLIPVEALAPLELKLNQPAMILPILENTVYDLADRSRITVTSTAVGNFISGKYVMSPSKEVMLIREDIYLPDETRPMVCNKHYIQKEHCHIEIHPKKISKEDM